MDFKLSILFVAALVFLSGSAVQASICVVPEVPEAIDRAEAVFVGKIVQVVPVEMRAGIRSSSSDHFVDFEIEQTWKGNISKRLRVLWRSEMVGCPTYPVGETGETYLVYADGRKDTYGPNEPVVEVTIFNRTSFIPPTSNRITLTETPIGRSQLVVTNPELDRRDASHDIAALRQFQACGCLLNSKASCSALPRFEEKQELRDMNAPPVEQACCTCLRRTSKLPSSGSQ